LRGNFAGILRQNPWNYHGVQVWKLEKNLGKDAI